MYISDFRRVRDNEIDYVFTNKIVSIDLLSHSIEERRHDFPEFSIFDYTQIFY